MKRKIFIIVCCILMIIFETLATTITDNDGSSFITKAEFDALSQGFQSQIDGYNLAIDSKIDDAIATYLLGLTMSKKVVQTNFLGGLANLKFYNDMTLGLSTNKEVNKIVWNWSGFTGTNNSELAGGYGQGSQAGSDGVSLEYTADAEGNRFVLRTLTGTHEINMISGYANSKKESFTPSFDGCGAGFTECGLKEFSCDSYGYCDALITVVSWKPTYDTSISEKICGTILDNSSLYRTVNELDENSLYVDTATDSPGGWHETAWMSPRMKTSGNHSFHKIYVKSDDTYLTLYNNKHITDTIGTPTKLYAGLPIFTSNVNGLVTVKLNYDFSVATALGTVEIKEGPFDNVDPSGTSVLTDFVGKLTNVTEGIEEYTWKTKKGETYWIKIKPTSGDVSVTVDGDVVVEQN